jgi:hypothetical protein
MRPALLAAVLAVPLLACENDKTIPTTVSWMEWSADVQAATPFRVRMVVYWPCAADGFRVGSSVNSSAVTLKPYFLRQNQDALCAFAEPQVTDLTIGSLDTAGYGPALRVSATRVFEMRAQVFTSQIVPLLQSTADALLPFGYVTIHPRSDPLPSPARRNAGGMVRVEVDPLGCVRIRTGGAFGPKATLVLDNPADTLGLSGSFARGYIYEPAAPMCGETEVFHWVKVYALDSRGQ